jgi:hypothetical protein
MEYFPRSQSLQDVLETAPKVTEYVPGIHFSHVVNELPEYVPAAHSTHVDMEIAPEISEYVPALHCTHVVLKTEPDKLE